MGKPAHVLFLDDEENILYALSRLLQAEPYGVVQASDPDQAMALIGQHPIKVVISDQRMPKISGVEFLRQVKERYPDKIRVLLSGYVDFATAEEAINLGEVYRFVTKPWNTAYLKASIAHGIEQYDLIQANRILLEALICKTQELPAVLEPVKVALDMLQSSAQPLNAEQTQIFTEARGSVERLNGLINDILAQRQG